MMWREMFETDIVWTKWMKRGRNEEEEEETVPYVEMKDGIEGDNVDGMGRWQRKARRGERRAEQASGFKSRPLKSA